MYRHTHTWGKHRRRCGWRAGSATLAVPPTDPEMLELEAHNRLGCPCLADTASKPQNPKTLQSLPKLKL